MTLAEFLTARLDEDEADATYLIRSDVYNILRVQSPARNLADVEAKRGILNLHEPYEYDATDDLHCAVCGDVPQVEYPCSTLLVLVQPYAAHPDFDPAWKIPPVMLGDGS